MVRSEDIRRQDEPAEVRWVSVNFQQLCGFLAIRQTQQSDDVLRSLLMHCLELYPDEHFAEAGQFQSTVDERFGLRFTRARLQLALDQALGRGQLRRDKAGAYVLTGAVQEQIRTRVQDAQALESRVRSKWTTEVRDALPELSEACAWEALQRYMTRVFRQHGIQTLALIDPTIEVPPEFQESLRTALAKTLDLSCAGRHAPGLSAMIEAFFARVSGDQDRIAYIVQLADSVVSYYSLTVRDDIADQLRRGLKPLVLFLDTNVLFGLIGLDDGPQVEVSHELVQVVGQFRLPFRLRYHSRTEQELRKTFDSAVGRVLGRRWPPQISRAVAKMPQISTIQRLYHERNAELSLSPETFFSPYKHVDVLIQEQGIQLYRDPTDLNRQPVYDLIADYDAYLKRMGRTKPYEALDHDMSLLNCVQRLRSGAKSSLDAEALLVTYDFLLYRFDWTRSRSKGSLASTVLPSQFLQLLRPFIPLTPDFDRSFAETFAIPEFRAMGGGAHLAAARLAEILASYEGLTEKTASAVLANDLILDGLQRGKSDLETKEFVESAIAAENAALVQEQEHLLEIIGNERKEHQAAVAAAEARAREEAVKEQEERERALAAAQQSALVLSSELHIEKARLDHLERASEAAAAAAEAAGAALKAAEKRAEDAEAAQAQLTTTVEREEYRRARSRARWKVGACALLILTLIAICEATIRYLPWTWMLGHPQSYGIRFIGYVSCSAAVIGLLYQQHRSALWAGLLAGGVLAGGALLGGPPSADDEPKASSSPSK